MDCRKKMDYRKFRSPDEVMVGSESLTDLLRRHRRDRVLATSPQVIPKNADLSCLDLSFKDLRGALLGGVNLSAANLDSADLTGANLSSSDLSGASLNRATIRSGKLDNVSLRDASLEEADLRACSLRVSDVRRARLSRADLRGAKLAGADLRGAVLSSADLRDLNEPEQQTETAGLRIGGADLSDARVPASLGLAASSTFQDAAGSTLSVFFFFTAGLVYSILMASEIKDDKLLPRGGSSPLPFLQTPVPSTDFFLITPVILLLLYAYLHFNLLRFFGLAADLPGRFPDGTEVCDLVRPWMLKVLFRRFSMARGTVEERLLGVPNISFLIWFIIPPAAIFLFWYRYLVFHLASGDLFLEGVGLLTLCIGLAFELRAIAILRPGYSLRRFASWRIKMVAVWAAVATAISISSTREAFADRFFANFESLDVTVRPDKWDGEKPMELRGAWLAGEDLRYANARDAFLVHADLRNADLSHAVFNRADLRGADFGSATVIGVDFTSANLRQAVFASSRFFSKNDPVSCPEMPRREDIVNFASADLTSASFSGAWAMCNVSFSGAALDHANFSKMRLRNADFSLSHAAERLSFKEAKLERATMVDAVLPQADFEGADLLGADLRRARFTNADFREAVIGECTDARGTDFAEAAISPEQLSLMRTDQSTIPPKKITSFTPSTPPACAK
jgi:uncharacterized protein YjbI with pentapeptide repeats